MGKGFPTKRQGRRTKQIEQLRSANSTAFLRGVGGDAISLEAAQKGSTVPRIKPTVIYTGGFMTPELNLPAKFRGLPVVAEIQ